MSPESFLSDPRTEAIKINTDYASTLSEVLRALGRAPGTDLCKQVHRGEHYASLLDSYFAAYGSLKLTRDAEGVLVVQFHTDGGPCTFSALHHAEVVDACFRSDASQHAGALRSTFKERIVREVGYGLSLEGASSIDLVKSKQPKSEPVAHKRKIA